MLISGGSSESDALNQCWKSEVLSVGIWHVFGTCLVRVKSVLSPTRVGGDTEVTRR